MCSKVVGLQAEIFDFLDDAGEKVPVTKFTWASSNNYEVEVINYGATITRILTPDRHNNTTDIVMGYDDITGYISLTNPYFGATVGRVANRIGNASFQIDGQTFKVAENCGEHALHGGLKGFDKVLYNYMIKDDTQLVLTYLSKDGEEGYPGNLLVTITMELTIENEFKIDMVAMTTKKTPINLTNHSYFNLAGHDSGFKEVLRHLIQINANNITETDSWSIPTGRLLPVDNTVYDFRKPVSLATAFDKQTDGFDNNFCIDTKSDLSSQRVRLLARTEHPSSGRFLEIYSNQVGCQFYTANFLPEPTETDPAKKIIGKNGRNYEKCGSFCFESQNYPDAMNHANFPNGILSPGDIYHHTIIFKFGVQN